ncbi:hypothetical protein [Methylotenera sp.]|uniref:hypothetical protein n=1 Tax=Methylotenera sp. TaxID=2051956 RepID=UPI0024879634|nr:hypothetical protein [Methylotenera sp.]MDI1362534.1 hypothetical protein [Methylotenera sp.]
MQFIYQTGTETRSIEFDLVVGVTDELIVPLKIVCDDIGLNFNRQKQNLSVEAYKIGGKGQAVAHCTLATLVKLFDDLTTPDAHSKLKPDSQARVKQYYLNFANMVNAHHNPTKVESVVEIYNDLSPADHLRRDLFKIGCKPSEIAESMRTGQLRMVSKSVQKASILSDRKEPPVIHFSRKLRELGTSYQDAGIEKVSFHDYVEGTLLKINSVPLSKFEITHPDHKASQRQIDYLNDHDVINGKLVKIEPKAEVMPWDDERSYIGVKK